MAKKATKRVRRSASATQKRKVDAVSNKAKDTAVLNALKPLAKEINVRFDKASQAEEKADDHRLAAALVLATAKQKCADAKITFKKWAEANIKMGYVEARKLALIGESDNPGEALAAHRAGSAERAAKSRATKAVAAPSDGSTPTGSGAASRSSATLSPAAHLDEAFETLGDKASLNYMGNAAAKLGMRIVSDADAKLINKSRTGSGSLAEAKEAFDALKASEKMELVNYAADAVGVKVDSSLSSEPAGDAEMPGFLRRGKKGARRGKKK